jgi:phytoene dehydrogenase-like protein
MKSVAIIGGGIAGLTCGYELGKAGIDFKLFEQNSVVSGRVRDMVFEGRVIPVGARGLSVLETSLVQILKELGLSDKLKPSSIYENRGIYSKNRMIHLTTLSILFDTSISFKTKLDLRRFRKFLSNLARNPSMQIPEVSLREYMLANYSSGVLEDFVEPFVRAEFNNSSDLIPAAGALRRLIAAFFRGYELDGGLMTIATALQGKISDKIITNAQVTSVENLPSGGFDVSTTSNKFHFDIVVCCVPVVELEKFLKGVVLPDVTYVPKQIHIVKGKSKYPKLSAILVGEPKYNLEFVLRYGPLYHVSSSGGEPDFSAFFSAAEILYTQKWKYGASRMGRVGVIAQKSVAGQRPSSPKQNALASPLDSGVDGLYLAGDFVFGGGVGSAAKAGKEASTRVIGSLAK